MSTVTVSHVGGADIRLTIDIDPYTGEVSLTDSGAAMMYHFGSEPDAVDEALESLTDLIQRYTAERLAVAPWVES